MENFIYNEGDNSTPTTTKSYLVEAGVGLLVLFTTIWIVGKAWKQSQK
jgi:hypothetical protein